MKITRRSILQAVVVAVPGLEACSSSVDSTTPVVDGQGYFPQSLASGDPRPDRLILWTRAVDVANPDGAWQRLDQISPDLDFVIFLGDYIYETTGDPSFMSTMGTRTVELSDPGSALKLGSSDAPYLAAQSVSNYRDLYKTVRSDPFLRA